VGPVVIVIAQPVEGVRPVGEGFLGAAGVVALVTKVVAERLQRAVLRLSLEDLLLVWSGVEAGSIWLVGQRQMVCQFVSIQLVVPSCPWRGHVAASAETASAPPPEPENSRRRV
jgi:hypothetical protein